MTAFVAKVHGRVQGVGFRYSAQSAARRLKITGWVRNEPDGTVSTRAEGDESSIQQFKTWLETGPLGARVTAVDIRTVPPQGTYRGFKIEY